MENCVKIRVKVFTVDAHNPDTDQDERFVLPVTMEQLWAAHDAGITTDELLSYLLAQDGFTLVRRIGKPCRRNVPVDLVKLLQWAKEKKQAQQHTECTGNVWMKQRVCDLDGYEPPEEDT